MSAGGGGGKRKGRGARAPAGLVTRMRLGRGWAGFGLARPRWPSSIFFSFSFSEIFYRF